MEIEPDHEDNSREMDRHIIRNVIYQGYRDLLSGRPQGVIPFPRFYNVGDSVYLTEDITDSKIDGRTYLVGDEEDRWVLADGHQGIAVRTEDGVVPFELYSHRSFRPLLISTHKKVVVADMTALEDGSALLNGYTPEEVVRANFEVFSELMEKRAELKEEGLNSQDLSVALTKHYMKSARDDIPLFLM